MNQKMLLQEYRTYNGKPDYIYENMLMCKDKTWLAVEGRVLQYDQQLCNSLHDITLFAIVAKNAKLKKITLNSSAKWINRRYCFVEGNYNQKLATLNYLLNNSKPVYIGTIHPLLPFSQRYNPNIDITNYKGANHIFSLLGKERDEYIYFDTSSFKSDNFKPHPKNKELGLINIQILDHVLRRLFQLSYTIEDKVIENNDWTIGNQIINYFYRSYKCNNPVDKVFNGDSIYCGRIAWLILEKNLNNNSFNTLSQDSEFDFITKLDILCWKLKDLYTRCFLLAVWCEKYGDLRISERLVTLSDLIKRLFIYFLNSESSRLKNDVNNQHSVIIKRIIDAEDDLYDLILKIYTERINKHVK